MMIGYLHWLAVMLGEAGAALLVAYAVGVIAWVLHDPGEEWEQ